MTDVTVKFAPRQSPPPGYAVEWWESDEMYRWVEDASRIDGEPEVYGEACCCRWMARRGAWARYRARLAP
jgi:hypothetical protein